MTDQEHFEALCLISKLTNLIVINMGTYRGPHRLMTTERFLKLLAWRSRIEAKVDKAGLAR